jgi:beta-glucosidase
MVVGYIKGVQDQGISACVKHYAGNNQEAKRFTINVEMSERALREIYLPGFKAAVQEAGVNTLMGSYNKFRDNGLRRTIICLRRSCETNGALKVWS